MAALINLTVNSSTAQAQSDLNDYVSKSEEVRAEVEKFKNSFDGKELDSFLDKTNRVSAAVTATDGPLKGMKTEQKALRKEIQSLISKGLDPQSDALAEITARYDKVTAEVESLEAQEKKLKAESAKAAKIAKTQALETKNLATQQKAANTSFANGAKKLITMAAAYLSVQQSIAFMKEATTDAMEYSGAIANVNTMLDFSIEEFQSLDKALTSVSEEFAVQKTELAAGVYQSISAGANSLAEAQEIVKQSVILSTGALIDNADAVNIVTTAMNAYGPEVVTAANAVDNFFTIVKEGKITGQELASSIGDSISLFAQAKIPLSELGSGIAALTKVGVPASEATTQLNAIVTAFLKPATAMTDALEAQGYASGSALLETKGLAGAISFLKDETGGSLDEMARLIPKIRGFRGAVSLSADDMKLMNEAMDAFVDSQGAGLIAAEKMTGGFNEQAFDVEQAKIKLENFRIELGNNVLPIISSAIDNADKLAYGFLAVASGLTAFLIVTKGATIISVLTTAFWGLNAAIAANPIGAVAIAITAVLVPALVYLYKNWDTVSVYIQTGLAILDQAFSLTAVGLKTGWTIAVNSVKIAFVELLNFITGGFLTGVIKVIELSTKIPFIGDKFSGVLLSMKEAKAGMQDFTDGVVNNAISMVSASIVTVEATKAATDENIKNIKAESAARLEALELASAGAPATSVNSSYTPYVATDDDSEEIATLEDSLSTRLAILNNAHAEELDTFASFYQDRMAQEGISGEARIAFLEEESQKILDLDNLTLSEKFTAMQAVQQEITSVEKEQSDLRIAQAQEEADAKRAILESSLNAYSSIFGSVQDIMADLDDSSKASIITQKVLASAQAGINSYLAFTEVLKDPSYVGQPWLRGINAAGVLASGLAAQVSIASTSIPTAQTGTGTMGITIPDTGSASTDNVAVMASAGERVSVTPRNASSGNTMRIIVNINGDPIIDTIQTAMDNGDLIVSAENIQGA